MINEDEEKKDSYLWTSCCLKLDKRATIFFSQLSISLIIIAFCLYQLVHLVDCEPQQAYIGLLTLVLGVWLPQPNMKIAG